MNLSSKSSHEEHGRQSRYAKHFQILSSFAAISMFETKEERKRKIRMSFNLAI